MQSHLFIVIARVSCLFAKSVLCFYSIDEMTEITYTGSHCDMFVVGWVDARQGLMGNAPL